MSRPLRVGLAVLFVLSLPVRAATLEGVTLQDSLEVSGQVLRLNGVGLRTKLVFRVYVGGLYLSAPARSEQEILGKDVPRAIVMHFLRHVERDKLVTAYREGFMANAPALADRLRADIGRLLAAVPDVREGDRILFTYAPGIGSVLTLPDGIRVEIPGKDFGDLYSLLYLGPKPPTDRLKRGLLGLPGG